MTGDMEICQGVITIEANEKRLQEGEEVTLRFKVNLFSNQGIYFIVYVPVSTTKFTPLYQSEIQLKIFHWEPFRLNRDQAESSTVVFYKAPENNGRSKLLGSANLTMV